MTLIPFTARRAPSLNDFAGELDRFFDSFWRTQQDASGADETQAFKGVLPLPLDISESEDAYHVSADMPGLKIDDLDITLADGILTIRGEKTVERSEEGRNWHRSERRSGQLRRAIALPDNADPDKVEAALAHGVLKVDIAKRADAKNPVRKITVKSA